jgi:1,4-dihydroxy-2-naphthoyl-CoA hydrolase
MNHSASSSKFQTAGFVMLCARERSPVMTDWNVGLMAHLGMRFVEVGADRVVAELELRDELTTVGGAVHGGTLMALADTVGAAGTAAMGLRTATLESKTNFFAAALAGKIRAESTALHKGKRTHVWQTRVTDETGRLLSLTIQTQMIL